MMTDLDQDGPTRGAVPDEDTPSDDAVTDHGPNAGLPGGRPPGPSADSRNFGALAHLSAFVGFAGVPTFLGPLAAWLLLKDRDPFAAAQAREALNFNLSLLLYAGIGIALSIVTIGLGLVIVVPIAIVAALAWLVLTVLAAIRSADGQPYRYPMTLRLVS